MKQKIKLAQKALIKQDPELRGLFKRHSLENFKPQMKRSPFESLVRAIAHQQLHGKAAETILGRMIALFPDKSFPSPEDLTAISVEKLRACGFSQSKVKSIKDIALKTIEGLVPDGKSIRKMKNDEIITRLTEIHGVGRWTVEMLLIFQLGRLDIWPIDDFGVRKGFQVWKRKRSVPTAKQLKGSDSKWNPYQTLVALCLWREADLVKLNKKT